MEKYFLSTPLHTHLSISSHHPTLRFSSIQRCKAHHVTASVWRYRKSHALENLALSPTDEPARVVRTEPLEITRRWVGAASGQRLRDFLARPPVQEICENGSGRRGRRGVPEMSVLSIDEDFGASRLPSLSLCLGRCARMRSSARQGKKRDKEDKYLLPEWLARSCRRRGQAFLLVPARLSRRTRLQD